jgi:hypothetical protein
MSISPHSSPFVAQKLFTVPGLIFFIFMVVDFIYVQRYTRSFPQPSNVFFDCLFTLLPNKGGNKKYIAHF